MDEIVPGLWLGDLACVQAHDYLELAGVTHIVSAIKQPLSFMFNDEAGIKLPSGRIIPRDDVKQVKIDDVDSAPILVHFGAVNEVLDSVLQEEWRDEELEKKAEDGPSEGAPDFSAIREQNAEGRWGHWETLGSGTVFVHCQAGVSRSVTLVAAYLMWRRQISASEALELIRARRSQADPNAGFIAQLELYEQCDYQVDMRYKAVRRYLMSKTNILNGGSPEDMLLSYYPSPYPSPGLHRASSASMALTKSNTSNGSDDALKSLRSMAKRREDSIGEALETSSSHASSGDEPSSAISRRGSASESGPPLTPLRRRRPRTFSQTSATSRGKQINLSVSPMEVDGKGSEVGYFPETKALPPAFPSSSLAQPTSVEVKVTETRSNARLPGGVSSLRGNVRRASGSPAGASTSAAGGSAQRLPRPQYSGPKLRCKMCRRELASTADHLIEHEAGRGQMAFEHRKRNAADSKQSSASTRLSAPRTGSAASAGQPPAASGEQTESQEGDAGPSDGGDGAAEQEQPTPAPVDSLPDGRQIQSAASLSASLPPHLAALRLGRAAPPPPISTGGPALPTAAAARLRGASGSSSSGGGGLSLPSPSSLLPSAACSSYFVEPLNWMDALKDGEVAGRLDCPNKSCGAKLGSWDWAGMQCGCGAWITPAFALHCSKVDVLR